MSTLDRIQADQTYDAVASVEKQDGDAGNAHAHAQDGLDRSIFTRKKMAWQMMLLAPSFLYSTLCGYVQAGCGGDSRQGSFRL
jgi:hypothetical protein